MFFQHNDEFKSNLQEGVFVDHRQKSHTDFNVQPFDRDALIRDPAGLILPGFMRRAP